MAGLLKVAALARSTFYYQCKALRAGDKHAPLKATISAVFERHKGRYGYRRVTDTIRQMGNPINRKKVQRLMGLMQLKSVVRPKKYRTYRGTVGRIAPNVLQRQFEAHRPNQKWVTDVTEFKVGDKKLYLSPALDLFNGEIIAYLESQDTVYVGTIKGVGRIYQQTFVDTYSKVAIAKLYTTKTPITAADLLNDRCCRFSRSTAWASSAC